MPVPPRRPAGRPAAAAPLSPPLPRHHTAYLLLCQRLEAMEPDAMLPGEHELAGELGVSRITLRRALARLAEEGRVLRRPGHGTRVCRQGPGGGEERPTDTVAQLMQIGRRTSTEVLDVASIAAPAEVAEALRLPAGTPVRRARLLRRLGRIPVSHLVAFFPLTPAASAVTPAVLAQRPLLAVTEDLGGPVRDVSQRITSILADAPLASLLAVEAGAPLVRVERLFVGRRGPLQFSIAHYRADCFAVETQEWRSGKGWRSRIEMRLAEHDGGERTVGAARRR